MNSPDPDKAYDTQNSPVYAHVRAQAGLLGLSALWLLTSTATLHVLDLTVWPLTESGGESRNAFPWMLMWGLVGLNLLVVWGCQAHHHIKLRRLLSEQPVAPELPPSALAQSTEELKAQLLANLSHEVRTPVAAVCSYLNLMQRATPAQMPQLVRNARASAQHLMDVTQTILDAAKIQAHKMSLEKDDVSLRQLLVDVGSVVNLMVERKNLDFYVCVQADTPDSIEVDPLRLRQILLNLISNAVKFTHDGHIALKVSAHRIRLDQVQLNFAVTDTGIGVDPSQQERMFESFAQADGQKSRKYGGTGLGLYICRQLAELMDGQVDYAPNTPGGSVFTLRIPVPSTSLSEVGYEARYPGRRLVVVSVNPEERQYLTDSLGPDYGTALALGTCGELNGALVPEHAAETDLLVGKTNQALLKCLTLLSTYSSRKVGLISALGQGHEASQLEQTGVVHHVVRPALPHQILDVFEGICSESLEPNSAQLLTSVTHQKALLGKRLLVAEDTELLRDACAGYLESYGAEVDTAASGAEAVRLALSPTRHYDLVLMDIQMPDMDGNQACRLIRQHLSASILPIYALTSHVSWRDVRESLDAGMNGHFQKPLKIRELFRAMGLSEGLPEDNSGATGQHPALLDWRRGLCNFSGNTKVYTRTLNRFRDELDRCEAESRLFSTDNKRTAMATLHKVKGMAATVGAHNLSLSAERLHRQFEKGSVGRLDIQHYVESLQATRLALNDLEMTQDTHGERDEAVATRRR
ncbi:MAG: ATP-binding protein [Limnobacter sp.]|uniref:hybrid sensor histidine kinase/response regulator n=1 Tax=Limnobacter sp. TaxID=2003368 RepID=UPI00391AB1DF